MIIETMLGVAIAAGVIGVILVVKSLVSRVDFGTPGVERVTVLVCEGEAEGLEYAVRDAVSRRGRVYILCDGASAGAMRRAQVLALRYGAPVTDGSELTEELRSIHGRE